MKLLSWKYRYFLKKIRGIEKTILDLEFKRFKTQEIREEIRQEYDLMKSKLFILEEQIKKQKESPTMEPGDIARLDDDKVILERDIRRFEDQITALDNEVSGARPSNENPEGIQGITQQLDALQELKGMVKDYVKRIS